MRDRGPAPLRFRAQGVVIETKTSGTNPSADSGPTTPVPPPKLDLTSLAQALAALDRGLARWGASPIDEELRDACIQRFEFTFEPCWKMFKRRLQLDLPDAQAVDGLPPDLEDALVAACGMRNVLTYLYDTIDLDRVIVAVDPAIALYERFAA